MLFHLLVSILIVNQCNASGISNSKILSYSKTSNIGPFWTYPVSLNPRKKQRFDYFYSRFKRESNADPRTSEEVISDHEFPRDISTKPDYRNKGSWAKGKIPGKEIELGFVPLQVYSQVRRYDTVEHLPQSAAIAEATTSEEKANAPRLREVISNKKIQQVYEEEGYEDSGYDHGGYNHHGAKYEDTEKDEEATSHPNHDSQHRSAEEVNIYAKPNGEKLINSSNPLLGGRWKSQISETNKKSTSWKDNGEIAILLEEASPKVKDSTGKYVMIDGQRVPTFKNSVSGVGSQNKTTVLYFPDTKTDIEKSRESLEESSEGVEMIETAESRSGVDVGDDRDAEGRVVNDPTPKGSSSITFPGRSTRRQYAIGRPSENWTPMAPADVFVQESIGYNVRRPPITNAASVAHNLHHYIPYIPPQFPTYYSDNPVSYSSHLPPVLRLPTKPLVTAPGNIPPINNNKGPVQFTSAGTLNAYATLLSDNYTATTTTTQKPTTSANVVSYADIVQPRLNYTFDFFGSPSNRFESKSSTNGSRVMFGRQYKNFTRMASTNPIKESQAPMWSLNFPSLNTRHPYLPRESNEQLKQSSSDNRNVFAALIGEKSGDISTASTENGPVKYIEQLTIAHFSSPQNSYNFKSPPQVQNDRLIQLAKELNAKSEADRKSRKKRETSTIKYDSHKYPFYRAISRNNPGSKDSALKYAMNPAYIPKKTLGGMEFYESRDRLVRCEEPKPPEDIIPEREEDGEWNPKPQPNMPRLKGLGDSIKCLKDKYFGTEPLDNPFFQEGDIGDPPKFDIESDIKKHSDDFDSKLQTPPNIKRLMIIPRLENNTSSLYYNQSDPKSTFYQNHKIQYNNSITFPYKNHKPDGPPLSASIQNMRITSPFKYEFPYADSYYNYQTHEPPEEPDILDVEASKKHKHYHGINIHKHRHVHRRKPHRIRPHPYPVSIYSIIATNGYPQLYVPLVYAHSMKSKKVLPTYKTSTLQSNDNIASDTENYQSTPAHYYIIRPGELTQNQDLVEKTESTIWNFMNPFKWWFPSLFDNRRKEPKHRRRRSSFYSPYDKVLSRETRKGEEMVGEQSLKYESEIPANHKFETTTGPPISLEEFKTKFNITDKKQARLNRLTGGFISRNKAPILGAKITDLTPYVVLSTTAPPSTEPTSRSVEAPTMKPKVLFPRTRAPPRSRLPQQTKSSGAETKENYYTVSPIISTTSTTSAPDTVATRKYKPQRIVTKGYGSRGAYNAFSMLKRSRATSTTTENPFDSKETTESVSEEDNPRRLQHVEHRRVTKEEVYKTTYLPEEEGQESRNGQASGEEVQYSVSHFDDKGITDKPEISDNQTLTYVVNPITGVGAWGEQPRKRTWKPKRKTLKRQDSEGTRDSLYSYPTVGIGTDSFSEEHVSEQSGLVPRRKIKRQKNSLQENEAYILGLMSKVPPVRNHPRYSYDKKIRYRVTEPKRSQPQESQETEETYGEETEHQNDEATENYPPPVRQSPKYILEPDKRKYYYVED